MYRTLSQLRNSVNQLIEEQGEDAPCAAFIFTKEDVIYYKDGEDGFPNLNEEFILDEDDTDKVLVNVGGSSYIYEQVNEFIEDEVKAILNKIKLQK
jgi:hypothetical protein